MEKNFGYSFPNSWIWLNSFSSSSPNRLTLAGGKVLPGIEAYLIGYRSKNLNWNFQPIFSLRLFGWGQMKLKIDSIGGRVDIECSDWNKKIKISSQAPLVLIRSSHLVSLTDDRTRNHSSRYLVPYHPDSKKITLMNHLKRFVLLNVGQEVVSLAVGSWWRR